MGSDTGEAGAGVLLPFPGRLYCGVGEAMAHEDVAGRFDERLTCRVRRTDLVLRSNS